MMDARVKPAHDDRVSQIDRNAHLRGFYETLMRNAKMIAVAIAALAVSAVSKAAIAAEHTCDPVTDAGWSVVAERETLSQTDGPPYQSGADWFIDRVTTVLPFCHYFNSIGVYSMRSYSLDPVVTTEPVAICRRTESGSVAVPPYAGPCPPPR
jgi:hypothetical protein